MGDVPVKVYIYDLSKGLARSLSLGLLGKQIDGIWHTGIMVYNREYFYGAAGIQSCLPCGTILGQPDTVSDLGTTQIPPDMFMDYLQELSASSYRPERYHLFDHNCNTFSNDVAQFLTGHSIPDSIINLPHDVLSTPFGAMLRPMIEAMQVNPSGGDAMFSDEQGAASAMGAISGTSTGKPQNSKVHGEQQTSHVKESEPITYTDDNVLDTYHAVAPSLEANMPAEDERTLSEVVEFLSTSESVWSLGLAHMSLLAKLIVSAELSENQQEGVSGLLLAALLRSETIAQVQQDKEQHLCKLLHKFDLPKKKAQLNLAKAVCNCSSTQAAHDWLLSTEQWPIENDQTSNSQITVKICVTCLLHADVEVTKAGTSLSYNLTRLKVLEEVAVELGSALIQSLIKTVRHPAAKLCLESLKACMETSPEVTGLAAVMGLDIENIASKSPECRDVCRDIHHKLETFSI